MKRTVRIYCICLSLFFVFFSLVRLNAANPRIIDGTFLLRSRHDILEGQLRARQPLWQAQKRVFAKISKQMLPGQTAMNFQTYNFATGKYETITATLQAIGTHCYVFLQNSAIQFLGADPGLTIEQIKSTFDSKIYPTATDWFGTLTIPSYFSLPDEKVYILLLDIRDGLGGGYVAGYFDSRDLEGNLGNQKPIFFMDLNPGKTGDPSDKNNDFYRTIAHEFQHMINFSKHLPPKAQEDRWVEEGLSGLSEYFYTKTVGEPLGRGLPPSPHLARFLEYPDIVLTQNLESEWFRENTLFRHYGASFLFFYYLQEKYGGSTEDSRKAFVRSVVDSGASNGISGLNSLMATKQTTFIEVLKNWMIANHLNNSSINNGLWGYSNKEENLGGEASKIPIKGSAHTYSASGLSFIGGEGQISMNSGKYEDIYGTGKLQLLFKGLQEGFTPFLAMVDFSNGAKNQDISIDSTNTGSISIDLSNYKNIVLVPAFLSTEGNNSDLKSYRFSSISSKVVLYPIPNPAFSREFIIVLKSLSGGLAATPTVSVVFNNIQDSPSFVPTDAARTVFVANYTVPGTGGGVVTASYGSDGGSFSFFSSILSANNSSRLRLKEIEFSLSSRVEEDNAFIYESTLSEIPAELKVLSKPYFVVFNSQNAIEAKVLFDSPFSLDVASPSQIGLWFSKNSQSPWVKVSQNERGFFSPISQEGLYVLVADSVLPKIHDLRIEDLSNHPRLVARISDEGSGINRDSIRVEVNGESVPFAFDLAKGQVSADLLRLAKGQHRFSIELSDRAENKGRAVLNQVLSGPLKVVQTTAYPNPSRRKTYVTVILDGNGSDDPTLEVETRIYDLSGHPIRAFPLAYKSNRTFNSQWDQRNEDGKLVANGIYLYKVVISKGDEKIKTSGKIAVLN